MGALTRCYPRAPVRTGGPSCHSSARMLRRQHPRSGKHSDEGHELTVFGGLAALSLDALSSVAYGPEAMVLVLVTAGIGALKYTVPITVVIVAMLALLVLSYSQVIAAYPQGGGAYSVAKPNLGRWPSLLAAAAVVVDYVLTVAVSLAAGAAALGSVFHPLSAHLMLVSLIGLAVLTVVNMFGIAESARLLMVPTLVFIVSILAVIAIGAFHFHIPRDFGTPLHNIRPEVAVGVILLLKAFASGCSAVTGVEAISNGTPAFREPRIRRAQRTELTLGVLLGVMLLGIVALIHTHHVVPRGGVTILAQVSAGAFGKGWAFYVSNLSVALVLGLAANTSFGGLPVLTSILARDNRLPHYFGLRAERPVYRVGIGALALAAAALLVGTGADVARLIPLFTIGVFVGFTLSQLGMVRHWQRARGKRWRLRALLNGTGAVITFVAVLVFLGSKFLEGAWVVVLAVPALMYLFSHTERYYESVASQLKLGRTPPPPRRHESVVIVPSASLSALTERAISAALSLGETVIAVAVAGDEEEGAGVRRAWEEWKCSVPVEVIVDPHRSLVRSVLRYVESIEDKEAVVMVLIPEIVPSKRRHEVLHNQRGRILEAVLQSRTDVIVATFPFRIRD
jgi:amino acid transporter